MIHFDFSSDLDMGRRPELKSDKKSKCIIIVIEILSCEHLFTAKKVLRLFGASLWVLGAAAGCWVPRVLASIRPQP